VPTSINPGRIVGLLFSKGESGLCSLALSDGAANEVAGNTSINIYEDYYGLRAVVKKTGEKVDSVEIHGQRRKIMEFLSSVCADVTINKTWLANDITSRPDPSSN
jgi:hypothetical protein